MGKDQCLIHYVLVVTFWWDKTPKNKTFDSKWFCKRYLNIHYDVLKNWQNLSFLKNVLKLRNPEAMFSTSVRKGRLFWLWSLQFSLVMKTRRSFKWGLTIIQIILDFFQVMEPVQSRQSINQVVQRVKRKEGKTAKSALKKWRSLRSSVRNGRSFHSFSPHTVNGCKWTNFHY